MKKNIAKILVLALLVAVVITALASCGIVKQEYRMGLAAIPTENGQKAALVLIDSDDRIVLCRYDEVDMTYGKTASKKSLGEDYGMAAAGALAEWDEQVAHLERKVIGLTAEEIMALDGTEADIKAGCTMHPAQFTFVIEAAINNAKSAEVFTAMRSDVAIALALSAEKDGEGYVIAASGIALERGYTLDQRTQITKK